MMMDTKKEKGLPDQGGRIPRSRRGSNTVPAVPSSSSYVGLPAPCTSRGTSESVSEGREGGSQRGSPAADRVGTRSGGAKALPRIVSVRVTKIDLRTVKAFKGVKATLSSPPPPPSAETEDEGKRYLSGAETASLASAKGRSQSEGPSSSGSDGSTRTTASGTVKRRKKGKSIAPREKRGRASRRQEDPNPVWSLSPGEEEELVAIAGTTAPREETRGRPATTSEGFFAHEKAQAKRELEKIQEQHRQLQKLVNNDFEPREYRGGARKRREETLEGEMRNLPTCDIAAQLILAARRVEEIAGKSGNLKGGFVRQLKEAALSVEVGVDALAARSGGQPEATSSLRAEIAALTAEVKELRAERERGWNPPGKEGSAATPGEEEDVEMGDDARIAPAGEPSRRRKKNEGRTPPSPAPPLTEEEEEAPPVLRPALRGKRKELEEHQRKKGSAMPPRLTEGIVHRVKLPTREIGNSAGGSSGGEAVLTAERLEERLHLFQTRMMAEMERLFQSLKGGNNNCPSVPSSGKKAMGGTSGVLVHPTPAQRSGGGNERKEAAVPVEERRKVERPANCQPKEPA